MARDIGNNNRLAITASTQWPVELIEMVVEPGNSAATIRYTNLFHDVVFDGNTYSPVGAFLSISSIRDALEARDDDLTLTLSGVTSGVIALILNYEIPGSTVKIYRGFYDEDTGALVEDPYKVWDGIASSWNIEDDNTFTNEDAVVVSIQCRSTIEAILGRKNGVFTSPVSIQRYYGEEAESNARKIITIPFTGTDTTAQGSSKIRGFGNNILFPGDSSISAIEFSNSKLGCSNGLSPTQEACEVAGDTWTDAESTLYKSGDTLVITTIDDTVTTNEKLVDFAATINGSQSLGFTADSSTAGELTFRPKDFDATFTLTNLTVDSTNAFTIGTLTETTETATNLYKEGCFDFVAGLIEKDFHFGRPD